MTPDEVAAHFTRSGGAYHFARWGRPIAPVVLGVDDQTLATVKGAFEAVALLAGHQMSDRDAELGANAIVIFVGEWGELLDTPHLARMVSDLDTLVPRLVAADANQYRVFRFDSEGAIMACLIFLRMDAELSAVPAETLALSQVVQSMLFWSDIAFRDASPLAKHPTTGTVILRPEVGALIRAAYDPVLPDTSDDASHALRLHARIGRVE